mmetsp:Transcript_56423/g.161919  ORF Transcript_56423/g.161919 Transcript_56423/m.161919 type:complete len:211 (-) Transcript_56423:63-695(-)
MPRRCAPLPSATNPRSSQTSPTSSGCAARSSRCVGRTSQTKACDPSSPKAAARARTPRLGTRTATRASANDLLPRTRPPPQRNPRLQQRPVSRPRARPNGRLGRLRRAVERPAPRKRRQACQRAWCCSPEPRKRPKRPVRCPAATFPPPHAAQPPPPTPRRAPCPSSRRRPAPSARLPMRRPRPHASCPRPPVAKGHRPCQPAARSPGAL